MEHQPEQHLWGPRDDFKGPFYTSSLAHFVSEIGYHGCPDRLSLEAFLDRDSVWPWQENDQWLTHAVRPHLSDTGYNYRIPLMAKQIAVLFDQVPGELDDYILASQISQAEALKFFLERWRGDKGRRTGMLWWNLRDGWPIISDAIVDYYGRKKLAYDYLRRIQADVCVLCGEAAPDAAQPGLHPLIAVNDTLAPIAGKATVTDADTGRTLFAGDFTVDRNGRAVLAALPPAAKPAMWLLEWTVADGAPLRNHYLAGPRPFSLARYKIWLNQLGLARPSPGDP
jgi:beta-mannosidase